MSVDRPRAVRGVRRIRRGISQRLRRRRSVHAGTSERTHDRLLHERVHLPLRPDLGGAHGRRRPQRGALCEQVGRVREARSRRLPASGPCRRPGASRKADGDTPSFQGLHLSRGRPRRWQRAHLDQRRARPGASRQTGSGVRQRSSAAVSHAVRIGCASACATDSDGAALRRRPGQVVALPAASSGPGPRGHASTWSSSSSTTCSVAPAQSRGTSGCNVFRRTVTRSCRSASSANPSSSRWA